jgi:hypothetical protein
VLLLDISIFSQIEDESKIRSMNRKRGDEAPTEPVITMFWVAPEDERVERNSSPELALELERNSNFNEQVVTTYGCELS